MKRIASMLVAVLACTAPDGGVSSGASHEGLSGCHGLASSSQPSDGDYYLTSFGFSPSDNGQMSCGQYTSNGNWYYAASRQRFGCGAHIQIEANGKCVVTETDDYGPDECVEAAAGRPIIDASPLVSEALFGTQSAGWSDRYAIHVTVVDSSTALGPCAGGGDAGSAEGGGASCESATLGRSVPAGTCVQARSDDQWYQCTANGWESGGDGVSGPLGTCSASYPL